MLVKGICGVACVAAFGLIFVVAGFKRMLGRPANGRRAESIFWGAFGIVLGAAIIGGVIWFVFGPPLEPPDDPTPFIMP